MCWYVLRRVFPCCGSVHSISMVNAGMELNIELLGTMPKLAAIDYVGRVTM